MRRGPQLHYERTRMVTGFGLNVEDVQAKKQIKSDDEEVLNQPEEEEPNVLDWSNCSMLAFVSLFYVSSSHLVWSCTAEIGVIIDLAPGKTIHPGGTARPVRSPLS